MNDENSKGFSDINSALGEVSKLSCRSLGWPLDKEQAEKVGLGFAGIQVALMERSGQFWRNEVSRETNDER